MTQRQSAFSDFHSTISTWTVGGSGVSVSDDDDQNRFERFLAELDRHPGRKQAFFDILGRTGSLAGALCGCVHPHTQSQELREPAQAVLALPSLPTVPVVLPLPVPPVLQRGPKPKNPIRLSDALQRFKDNARRNRTTGERTVGDRDRFLNAFGEYLVDIDVRLGKDPWVHEIATHHLVRFLDTSALRSGRREVKQTHLAGVTERADEDAKATVGTLKPTTMLKRLSDLSSFFTWAHNELQATVENPVTGLEGRRRKLTKQANDEAEQYLPFESHHITDIFEPERYLIESRSSDFFWTPLLALHLGTRLKELVTMEMRSIERDNGSGIWFMDVRPEFAKNKNSARRLPITQPLIDLGFLDYLEQMRALGAKHLFPHRDLTGKTAQRLPSKLCGDAFAKLLDVCSIKHPQLVFHSFRHTVITALQDGNTPLSTSMQIVGHQAQDHAVRTGLITAEEARSVTLSTYTHADRPRMNVQFPLVPLKAALERCVQPPIDYPRLRIAADIVRENMVREGDKFVSGWPKLRRKYNEEILGRLALAGRGRRVP